MKFSIYLNRRVFVMSEKKKKKKENHVISLSSAEFAHRVVKFEGCK